MDEIEQMKQKIASGENPMEFKKKLAFEITKMYHNKKLALEAQDHFQKTVQNKEIPDDIAEVKVSDSEMTVLKSALPAMTRPLTFGLLSVMKF